MKKREKQIIAILVIITVVVIIVTIVINNNNKKLAPEENKVKEEFVNVLSDGTRQNTSSKLQETKTFDEMEISKSQVTEKDNVTLLLGTIINTSNTEKGEYPIEIVIVDKQGNEIAVVEAYIGKLKPGASTQLNASSTFDYANAYDFTIRKK